MWFKQLVGFEEESPKNVQRNIRIDGNQLISKVNGKSYQYGTLEILTLKALRKTSPLGKFNGDQIMVHEIVSAVQKMHRDSKNQNAFFQAASQFNLLEMVGSPVSP